jgi:hypothetical protein
MIDMLPALVIAGVGLMVLVLVALVVAQPARRFARASSALRSDLATRRAALSALVAARPRRRR